MSTLEVLSEDGCWKASAGPDHTLQIWKMVTGEPPQLWVTYHGHKNGLYGEFGTIGAGVWSPDATRFVSGSDNGSIHLLSRKGQHLATLRRAQEGSPVTSLYLLPDGCLFAYSGKERIGTWDWEKL
jgi:WD40 repeat protein